MPPGRTMMSTPRRPTQVAVQRRQPTWAPRNSAAPAVTASGTNCRMPKMSAIGMCTSAERKVMVPPRSAARAPQHGRRQRVRQLAQRAAGDDEAAPSAVVNSPRRKIASPVGRWPAAIFISVSLTTNTAIDASMARMPRRLSERAWAGRARLIEGCSPRPLLASTAASNPARLASQLGSSCALSRAGRHRAISIVSSAAPGRCSFVDLGRQHCAIGHVDLVRRPEG